jgi:hypothetical protein
VRSKNNKSPKRGRSSSSSPEVDHVQTRRMSLHKEAVEAASKEGDFSNFPEITK